MLPLCLLVLQKEYMPFGIRRIEAPDMQVAAITTDTAVANEIEVDMSTLLSKLPNA